MRIPRVEISELETGGVSEMPSNSLGMTGTLNAAHGGMDDIWGMRGCLPGEWLLRGKVVRIARK